MQVSRDAMMLDGLFCNSLFSRVLGDIENCMMSELVECDEKSISQIFKLLFEFFHHELNCHRSVQVNPEEQISNLI